MFDARNEERREVCRRMYHLAVADGCYLAARKYLRDALVWSSPMARSQSRTWDYILVDGKVHAFVYKCSY